MGLQKAFFLLFRCAFPLAVALEKRSLYPESERKVLNFITMKKSRREVIVLAAFPRLCHVSPHPSF